jgi:general secretion pathway protein B
MSYILDALKRADAERERGAVPGLQSRHATLPAAKADRSAQNYIWLAAAALALGGMAAGLWFWKTPAGTERLAAVAPAVATPPPLVQPVPPPILPTPASPPAVAPPRVVASSPPVVNRAAPKVAPRPAPAASAAAMPPPRPKTEPAAKAAPSQAAPPAVRLLSELPEDLRRQIPPLVITGSVYSSNPAKRLLLVNNQVLPQGSLAAPEVTLELIQAKSSVFSYQGTRFRVAH